MEQRNLAELTRTYRLLADNAVAKSDPEVRLWLYIAKGDCDNDLQFPEASRRDWEMVERLASQTNNQKWKYRSKGELAIPAYYMGDLASSRKLVSEALDSASAAGDSPSVVRLLTHIGAVYVMVGEISNDLVGTRRAGVFHRIRVVDQGGRAAGKDAFERSAIELHPEIVIETGAEIGGTRSFGEHQQFVGSDVA